MVISADELIAKTELQKKLEEASQIYNILEKHNIEITQLIINLIQIFNIDLTNKMKFDCLLYWLLESCEVKILKNGVQRTWISRRYEKI